MKKMNLFILSTIMLLSTGVYSQELSVDVSKSTLKWNAKKVTGEHYGTIKLKEGKFTVKGDQIVSGNFVIDMQTIVNEDLESAEWNKKLIDHLNSDDFFSTSTFKTALLSNIKSTKFEKDKAQAKADLTIKGQTHPIEFDVIKEGKIYKAKITVDRTKYNIRYGSGKFFENLGDKTIDDEFTLEVTIAVN
ncbi:MAG: YceI family protein [Bacteroidales bacterium]